MLDLTVVFWYHTNLSMWGNFGQCQVIPRIMNMPMYFGFNQSTLTPREFAQWGHA